MEQEEILISSKGMVEPVASIRNQMLILGSMISLDNHKEAQQHLGRQ
jgi:hypothetical protein